MSIPFIADPNALFEQSRENLEIALKRLSEHPDPDVREEASNALNAIRIMHIFSVSVENESEAKIVNERWLALNTMLENGTQFTARNERNQP